MESYLFIAIATVLFGIVCHVNIIIVVVSGMNGL